jgi:hypothetical protein
MTAVLICITAALGFIAIGVGLFVIDAQSHHLSGRRR